MKILKYILYTPVLLGLLPGCSIFGIRTTDEPDYKVLHKEGKYEIREYGPLIIAETTVTGTYKQSGNKAFRRIAAYIFGENTVRGDEDTDSEKIGMTAPVIQESEKIGMTAPVIQQADQESWRMAFVMPARYTIDTLPMPVDKNIKIREIAARKVATLRYSGSLSKESIDEHAELLLDWLKTKNYKSLSKPRSSAYDPPWTLPFLRRNEIHINIETVSESSQNQ